MSDKIGWIGIGRMGYAMAERLAKAGANLTVWNRTRSKAEPLADALVGTVDTHDDLAVVWPFGWGGSLAIHRFYCSRFSNASIQSRARFCAANWSGVIFLVQKRGDRAVEQPAGLVLLTCRKCAGGHGVPPCLARWPSWRDHTIHAALAAR